MARTVGIGIQSFDKIIGADSFYVDKTDFIREWWESRDDVVLITRPRRFGKTLNMSMMEWFFSVWHAGRSDLFEGLAVWQYQEYRQLQGTYPVISLSFATVKEKNYESARHKICQLLVNLYVQNSFLLEAECLLEKDKDFFRRVTADMNDADATLALYQMSDYLFRYYGKKVIILLDEYDTPIQEAYVNGYWEELVSFTRSLFNATFKTNPWLERAIMTGITRIAKESIFSDLNNLKVITTTSDEYGTAFGFTEEEVFDAMDEYGLSNRKEDVRRWYDGFTFGKCKDIYNPWSIINYLDTGKLTAYWANTSSNGLVGKLIREGNSNIKQSFERLLKGECLVVPMDEQIVYSQLDEDESAIWSLLLASGYLKVAGYKGYDTDQNLMIPEYELELTNYEVKLMFQNMIHVWFSKNVSDYNGFIRALLTDNKKEMNIYMNRIALETFSYFDTGMHPSGAEPERFYHGFVLGLIVELRDRYSITSNRESGFGRYDVMLEPRHREDDGLILEFKVYDPEEENSLADTVEAALNQIEQKNYAAVLQAKGVPAQRVRKYGFAFEGKKVLIG